jgi:D-alanyl-D-alanine carboxypeptidase
MLGGVAALLIAGCGQARFSAPPEPDFTHGRPAETTIPVTTEPRTIVTERPSPEAIEPDRADPIAPDLEDVELAPESTEPDPGGASVESMVIVDDAGVKVPNQSGWDAFDSALRQRLIPADVSASVAVLVDGTLVHQAAFGERIAGSGEPTEVTDRFRIASISKSITAIVVMQMVERGELTLDDPVGQIVIDHLGITATDPDAAGITVRQLLTHTAGFGKHRTTFFGNGAVSYSDAALIGMSGPVASGGGYTYSNMSYAVLSVLIEAVTGQTYERVVGDRLLAPLGFTDMRLTGTFEIGPDEVSHHATPGRNYMEALGGAGSWNATPTQVAGIYNSIDPATGGWKALTPESMAVMRYRLPTGSAPDEYGLGIINYPGDAWGHTGTIEHAHSMVLVQPDGVTWAISVSGETPSNTGTLRTIMRIALATGFPD